jgi:hypothetical protein
MIANYFITAQNENTIFNFYNPTAFDHHNFMSSPIIVNIAPLQKMKEKSAKQVVHQSKFTLENNNVIITG